MKKIIGITGPSGAGKSIVSKAFKDIGARVLDTDLTARKIVEIGKPAYNEIREFFGEDVIDERNEINRKALAKIVFNSPEALHKLNTITHKYIEEEIKEEIKNAKEYIIVIDAPALFESGIDKMCDKIICVTAEKNVRKIRIMSRDNLEETSAEERINAQKEDEFYITKSDYHIENNDNEDGLIKRAKQIIKEVQSE
ncbi:MAG: dephospho-CoA kinase [Clostridia bacterium]|nr:dephospho-CoA kinase [Clostridia bacterium]